MTKTIELEVAQSTLKDIIEHLKILKAKNPSLSIGATRA